MALQWVGTCLAVSFFKMIIDDLNKRNHENEEAERIKKRRQELDELAIARAREQTQQIEAQLPAAMEQVEADTQEVLRQAHDQTFAVIQRAEEVQERTEELRRNALMLRQESEMRQWDVMGIGENVQRISSMTQQQQEAIDSHVRRNAQNLQIATAIHHVLEAGENE